ncbi:MAG: hypothetical protein M1818_007359 [Claussenomyces sp. TS43310]|nr:MAG: hypothetical protein M1818_007359 [Claussenomyces sp. TS43310]
MSASQRRHRSSTAASQVNSESAAGLRVLLQQLSETLHEESGPRDVTKLVARVRQLRALLQESSASSRAKDTFRHSHGFSTLLNTIRATSGYYHTTKRSQAEKDDLFELLGQVLAVLSEVFRDHYGNRRYFKQRVEGGGWAALEQAIASIGLGGEASDSRSENRLFGLLLAFAVDDPNLGSICQDIIDLYDSRISSSNSQEIRPAGDSLPDATLQLLSMESSSSFVKIEAQDFGSGESFQAFTQCRLDELISKKTLLRNPDIAPTIIGFWKALPRHEEATEASTAFLVVQILTEISSISKSNLFALHATGILSALLPMAFDQDTPLGPCERQTVEDLCASLMSLGMSTLSDGRYLLRNKSAKSADFLLRMSTSTQEPPHIEFDLSLNGFASIELPSLGRPFPPSSSAPGYTFTAWIYIDRFDPNSHTTIFGAFDPSQTCFVLAYLEKDTHNFILQTSVTSTRPSVRFKSATFTEHQWYHVAVVHRRPRALTSSKAALFINGEFAEQVKCQYPSSPPPVNGSTESFASFASSSSSNKLTPIQLFLGTPQDLSSRLGQGLVLSRWSLASAHLFEDTLSDDFLSVHYRLGPRYNGNFQDCLGSFQTYEASAALGMRNDLIHPGKDEKSEIMVAIREKASTIVPESRILLSILPSAIISDQSHGETNASQLIRGLSHNASRSLYELVRSTGGTIVLNAAVPAVNEALVRANGTAILTGGPVIVVPQGVDNALWRLGGCASIGLKLVEKAHSREDIVRAVKILFENVKGSWRNSEAMERENGYAILAALIRGKVGAGVVISSATTVRGLDVTPLSPEEREKLSFELLSLVLSFVGYSHATPEDSVINNPLAYRVLLVDFDLWRKTATSTQKLYYKQFVIFGVSSKHHHFNSRRLVRMRIVRRFLDALKAENFLPDVFPHFLEALTTLVRCNMSAEVFRSLSLFITYALYNPSSTSTSRPRSRNGTFPSRLSIASNDGARLADNTSPGIKQMGSPNLAKRQVAIGVLEMYTDFLCEKGSTTSLRKFASTVTNKWLLHLLTEDEPQIVVLGMKILARLLVIHGSTYVAKFADKSGGFAIIRHRLKRWWDIPTLWPICFSILFNYDVAEIDYERPFDLFSLLDIFRKSKVVYPAIFPVITAMFQKGLNVLLQGQDDPDSPFREETNGRSQTDTLVVPGTPSRQRSMSLAKELESRQTPQPRKERLGGQAGVLNTVVRFLADLHANSENFRDFSIQSEYVRDLLVVLFPVIVSADIVSPETELNSRGSALTFEGDDVIIRPVSRVSSMPAPVVRTSTVETQLGTKSNNTNPKAKTLRRGSSFILLTAKPTEYSPSTAKLHGIMSSSKRFSAQQISNTVVVELLELVINVFIDQVLVRKEFPGFGLFLKVPPGFQEHQAYFASYVLRNTISQLSNTIKLNQKLLWEPKVITNMARFFLHMGEAIYEGWFLGGAEPVLDFSGDLLDYLQRPDISKIKSVRLCSQAIVSIRSTFLRVSLLRLSEIDDPQVSEAEALAFMNKLLYWQTVVISSENDEEDLLKLICYQLYTKLLDDREKIRLAAADLWRILLTQKPDEMSALLIISMEKRHLIAGFRKLVEVDNETFLDWVNKYRADLDALFLGAMSRSWEEFVNVENAKTDDTAKARVEKRRERLKHWHAEDMNEEDILFRYDLAANLWKKNIYASEHIKHQRTLQDQQDNMNYLASSFSKMDRDLHRPCAIFDDESSYKWKLDRTEGRNRMRLRMLPDLSSLLHDYQPKRKTTENSSSKSLRLATSTPPVSANEVVGATPTTRSSTKNSDPDGPGDEGNTLSTGSANKDPYESEGRVIPEEDFELVDGPNDVEAEEGYEDKNRKVMRSLQRGDQVQNVYNISRIIGLEACEGLLIVGKDSLYLMDNVFQRSDGEIVNAWQAPIEERDPYLQMISGQKTTDKRLGPLRGDQESRSWKWNDVLSISKRRFLFRDVAIEVFFTDGRSYLLTAISQNFRDDLHSKLISKAPHTSGASSLPNPEDAWRLDALKVQEDTPTGFGSKFGSIFNSSAWNPAMRRWAKGELSNFHYLMLVNTMAGRTFNDLTQYPVFPWVLADYTSNELDLDDPATFRDLSKPMGAQNPARQADFVDRYKQFSEMGDQPPFHYGTHYSSAMIVTSYLIRLQPFVQSYLLLQGGNFDHPDRLFYSIEKAWTSASRDNMTDVRELIPEFFYLPEFLINSNGYNFGTRQGNKGSIDHVALPPWAKGDPKIFIAKHREALESPYVSARLHQWIDLIFGAKQRGEAALENTNVFHHLSYHGAKDLDQIEDPVERLATIGIIHNFGQTPHQVFSRLHQAREDVLNKPKKLDASAETLTRLPFALLGKVYQVLHEGTGANVIIDIHERVATLIYSTKFDQLLCTTAFRLNIPPLFEKYMEWGFADNSIRFYSTDHKKLLGLIENTHQGQISTAAFADSRTLITAGVDCVISVWILLSHNPKSVELQPKTHLFGHKHPVSTIAVSRSFSTILSASTEGQVLLWDLNRLEFVRKLAQGRHVECAQINDVSGDIMLCRGQRVTLYTLNGDVILDQNICIDHDDYIFSCAFYEGTGNEWLVNNLIFTGHRRGVVNVWKKCVAKGRWTLELIKRLDHVDQTAEDKVNMAAAITCITPMAQKVYTGDEDGKIHEWSCMQRER